MFVYSRLEKLAAPQSWTSSVFFLSISLSLLSLGHYRVSRRARGARRSIAKKAKVERREKPVFKWASVIVSRGRGIKQDLLWRMCTGVSGYIRGRRMMPLHSYPSIWGGEEKNVSRRSGTFFDSFRLVIFLLRVIIIIRRKKFYVARGIRRLFGGKEIAILCATR